MQFNLQRFATDDSEREFLMNNLKGFVPTPIASEIIGLTTRGSSILRLSRVEMMESESKQYPVMTDGVGAYWVGEAERIKTSKPSWIFPELVAKKLAVIVPVTREKMKDSTINVFNTVKPYIVEAFQRTIDTACLFGTASPFARNIYTEALTNGMAVQVGSNPKLDLDISDVMSLVEEKGYDVNAFVADISFKNSLRKLRDVNGNQLYFMGAATGLSYDTLYSLPVEFSRSGAWNKTKALCIAGDFKNYSLVGIREQIEFEILQEATLQNVTMSDGKPLSLAENDLIAIKATMRIGFLPVKPEAFAVLVPAGTTIPAGAGSDTVQGGGTDLDGTDTNVTPSTP